MNGGKVPRRQFGEGIALVATFGLAGCIGGDSDPEDGDADPGTTDEDHDDHEDEGEVPLSQMVLLDHDDLTDDDVIATYHGHWHGELPTIELGSHLAIGADIEAKDGTVIPIGDDEQYQLDADVEDESIVRAEPHGDHLDLFTETTGQTALTIQLLRDGEVVWEASDSLSVTVAEA